MVEWEIRRAVPADAEAIADYHQRCFEETFASQLSAGAFEAPDEEMTKRQLLEWFQTGSAFETWVVDADGRPAAHFTVIDHHLVHLFVSPRLQGRGLGGHLLARAESMIAASGHRVSELKARVDNVKAIAFYVRAGWTVTDRLVRTVQPDISYDERVLVKRFGDDAETVVS